MEKLETLSECCECMKNFRQKAQQSLQYQKNLFDSCIQETTVHKEHVSTLYSRACTLRDVHFHMDDRCPNILQVATRKP